MRASFLPSSARRPRDARFGNTSGFFCGINRDGGGAYIPSLDDSSLTGATKYCCTKYNSGWMMNLEREEKYVDVKV